MNARIVQWTLLIGSLLALAVLAAARDAAQRADFSFYSTYDTGPHGYRALYEVLGKYGVPERRFEGEIGVLDADITTLVVSDNRADLIAGVSDDEIDQNDAQRLRRFVQQGGRLIVLARELPAALAGAFPVNRSVRRAGFTELRIGRGDLAIVPSPDRWSNADLDRGENAYLAFTLLADRGPIAFDERIHGYAQAKSMWAALPQPVHIAVWIACGMLALWLVESNVRFVPPTPVDPPDERDSSAYIQSMAELLRRARAGAAVIARFYDEALRRVTRQRAVHRPSLDELDRLSAILRPNDAMVLRAARLAAQLRKEYG